MRGSHSHSHSHFQPQNRHTKPDHTHFIPIGPNRLLYIELMPFTLLLVLPVIGTTIATSLGAFSFSGLSNIAGNALVAGIPLFLHAVLFLAGFAQALAKREIIMECKKTVCPGKPVYKSELFAVPALLAFSASYAILATTTSLGLHDLSFGGVISNEASILVFASAAAAMLGALGFAYSVQRDEPRSRLAPVLGFIAGSAVAAGVMCGLQYSDVLDLASAAMPAEAAIALISFGSAIAVSMLACAINYKVNSEELK